MKDTNAGERLLQFGGDCWDESQETRTLFGTMEFHFYLLLLLHGQPLYSNLYLDSLQTCCGLDTECRTSVAVVPSELQ